MPDSPHKTVGTSAQSRSEKTLFGELVMTRDREE